MIVLNEHYAAMKDQEKCPADNLYSASSSVWMNVMSLPLAVLVSLLLRCGDIELNPGPLRKQGQQ